MITSTVRHQALAGIGDLLEPDTASGSTITVVNHQSGRRDVAIEAEAGGSPAPAVLTEQEAAAMAMLRSGGRVELLMTTRA
jgi:K+/H+ antiporter YhaU regulatory subunit KhtT